MGDDLAGLFEEGGQGVRVGRKVLGLIVNPVAGIGGRVGLKGSDGAEIQRRALALGAVPQSSNRAAQALERLAPLHDLLPDLLDDLLVITCPGEMGEDAARACGLEPALIDIIEIARGSGVPGETTPEDTRSAAREMQRRNVDLLLFAGGDGTARDVHDAVGSGLPVLGIPAGVKIHSAVYATNPVSAGDLAASFLRGKARSLREAEVMDADEDAYRRGVVTARLYGYLKIPFERRMIQGLKAPSNPGEQAATSAIAAEVARRMADGWLTIIGPGTTTRAITSRLGLAKTLVGVDVVAGRNLLASDVNEAQLLGLLEGRTARIVVTPIGGQGYIFGRGNQQISPAVIVRVMAGSDRPQEHIIVVSTVEKVHLLRGRPLLVDTGEPALDRLLSGHIRVVTGYGEEIVYRVSC